MSKKKSTQNEKTEQAEAAKPKNAQSVPVNQNDADLEAGQSQAEQAKAEQAKAGQKQTGKKNDPAAQKTAEATVEQPSEQPDSQERCAELEAENQELKEALLRKQADFDNYRRRMQKEKEEAIQFANRGLISELLEVLDNFERALNSHRDEKETSPTTKTLFEGLELVEKQLGDILSSRWGLKPIDSVGQEFDPNLHEALMMEENAEYQVATVVENFQTGYTLHDRVLRAARVKVAKPKS